MTCGGAPSSRRGRQRRTDPGPSAAIDIIGVHGGVAVPIPGTPTDSGDRYDSGTPFVLIFAAVLLAPLIVIALILRRKR